MIAYSTLYWILCLIIFIVYQFNNSFDKSFLPLGRLGAFLNSMSSASIKESDGLYSTHMSRFVVSFRLYVLSWLIWFIIW